MKRQRVPPDRFRIAGAWQSEPRRVLPPHRALPLDYRVGFHGASNMAQATLLVGLSASIRYVAVHRVLPRFSHSLPPGAVVCTNLGVDSDVASLFQFFGPNPPIGRAIQRVTIPRPANPGNFNENFSPAKEFLLTESIRIDLGWEMFNALNRFRPRYKH